MQDIYFDDLAQPQLSPLQRLIMQLSKLDRVKFDKASLLKEVRKKVGDLDPHIAEVEADLQILLDQYGQDSGLSNAGKRQAFDHLVLCLSNRALIKNALHRNAERLSEQPLNQRHLIVAGLPRSGTTHLLNLLAADSRFRALPLWVADEPVQNQRETVASASLKLSSKLLGYLVSTPPSNNQDPRHLRCSKRWSLMQLMAPKLAAMHPMDPDHIHEEYGMTGYNFGGSEFEWRTWAPKWRDHYQGQEQFDHYAWLKQVLSLLQLDNEPDKPWVLKSVQHLERLPELRSIFPEATIVFTHRDPVAVIQSAATMITYGQRMQRREIDPKAMIDYWTDRIEWMLRRSLGTRDCYPVSQRIDVLFQDFMRDDLGTVEAIYKVHGIELDQTERRSMQSFIDKHQRGKHGRVRYNLRDQFGVDPDKLMDRFQFYYDAFAVRKEVA